MNTLLLISIFLFCSCNQEYERRVDTAVLLEKDYNRLDSLFQVKGKQNTDSAHFYLGQMIYNTQVRSTLLSKK